MIRTDKNPLDVVPGFKFKGEAHVAQFFDSFGELVKHCDAMQSKDSSFARYLDKCYRERGFVGGETYQSTCDKVVFGCPKLGAAADKLVSQVNALTLETDKKTRVRSVAGGRPCVPAVVSGSMVPMRRKVTRKQSFAPLSVVVNVNSSGMIRSEVLQRRGVAIAALVKMLAAKRPVNLYVMGGLQMSGQATYLPFVKFPTNPVDIKRLAYVLASQGVARGLFFALSGTANVLTGDAERSGGSGYIHWPFSSFAYIGDKGSNSSYSNRNIGDDLATYLKTDMLYIPGIFGHSEHVSAIQRDAVQWINDTSAQYTQTKEI